MYLQGMTEEDTIMSILLSTKKTVKGKEIAKAINKESMDTSQPYVSKESEMHGYNIFTNPLLTKQEQYRFPKRKSNRRWVKKFAKKYVRSVPSDDIIVSEINKSIFCHPAMEHKLRELLANQSLYQKSRAERPQMFDGIYRPAFW